MWLAFDLERGGDDDDDDDGVGEEYRDSEKRRRSLEMRRRRRLHWPESPRSGDWPIRGGQVGPGWLISKQRFFFGFFLFLHFSALRKDLT